MRTHALTWWLATICFLSYTAVALAEGRADSISGLKVPSLETLGQLTRLQIPVTVGSSFRMLTGKGGEVTLIVDRVTTSDLNPLSRLSDSRVEQVSVRVLGLDKAEILVRFRETGTESFAYQQGNSLVLDLWKGNAPVEANKASAQLPEQVKLPPSGSKRSLATASRKTAVAKKEPKLAAAPDSKPAMVEPLRIERDLFQKFYFPMPEVELKAKDKGLDLPLNFEMESRWKFSKGDKANEDGKGFEFAKSLFEQKKFGLCLKTIEIILRDQPQTKHEPELIFLRALAYKKLGEATKADFLVNKAAKLFEELAARRNERGEPFPFQRLIVLHFAQNELSARNWLAAIQHLESVSSHTSSKDPEFPYIQFLLAESYSKVNQPRRAERLYRFLTERFPKHILAKESAYRIAELLALSRNYQRTTEEAQSALQSYPEFEKTRPEVLFYQGEAYFWLGNYTRAEKSFRRYTEVGSSQTNSSLAWVRLGEIEEVQHSNTRAAREKYFRAKNGYPFSRGDLVASVRLARIDLPTEKEPAFVVRTLKEMLADETIDWDLKRMAELTLADYMLMTGETDRSIEIASKGMAQTDGSVYELYKRAYQKGLFTRLSQLTSDKKYSEALALYDREKKWLEQYGPETLRVASGIYRGLGLYATANNLMVRYGDELAKGRSPANAGATMAGQKRVKTEKAANSFARGAYTEALESLEGSQDAMSTYMRAMSHFRIRQKAQAYAAADRLLPMIAGAKESFSDSMIEDIAEILIERDNNERDFGRMEKDVANCRALMSKENERLSFAVADTLWYQKRHKEAAQAYREALTKHPTGIRAERGKYNMGMSLVGLGQRDEAVKLLTELQNSGQSVWAESAKQEIQLIEWEKKYSSVLRTLPPSGLGIAN